MKYIITESQVGPLLKVYSFFLSSQKFVGVCNIDVDYDDVMGRFVLNIFFDTKYILKVDKQGMKKWYQNKIVNDIGNKFYQFTNVRPLMYDHYTDCN
jgi:hypothetical protein